jgi:hypothetical protein
VAEIEAESVFRLPSPLLQSGHLVQVAERIQAAFTSGIGLASHIPSARSSDLRREQRPIGWNRPAVPQIGHKLL